MDDLAPGLHHAHGADVAAVDGGRGAGDQQQVGAIGDQGPQFAGDGGGVVRAAAPAAACRPDRRRARGGLDRALDDTLLEAGQLAQHQADAAAAEFVQRDGWRCAGEGLDRGERGAGHGEGDDLDGGDHVAGRDLGKVGQGGDGEGFVGEVDAVDRGRIDPQQAGRIGMQVDPAGDGTAAGQQRAVEGTGHPVGGLVLGHVAGGEAGGDDLAAAGGLEGDGGFVEHGALLEHAVGQAVAVGEDIASASARGRWRDRQLLARSVQGVARCGVQRRQVSAHYKPDDPKIDKIIAMGNLVAHAARAAQREIRPGGGKFGVGRENDGSCLADDLDVPQNGILNLLVRRKVCL